MSLEMHVRTYRVMNRCTLLAMLQCIGYLAAFAYKEPGSMISACDSVVGRITLHCVRDHVYGYFAGVCSSLAVGAICGGSPRLELAA